MANTKQPKWQPEDAANDTTNPAKSEHPQDAYSGRPDQGVVKNIGTGAGGATEWGGGNKNHPSRNSGKPGQLR